MIRAAPLGFFRLMLRLLRRTIVLLAVGVMAVSASVIGLGVATIAALPLIAERMPLELSRLVVADGRRQVEMQGMAHLASPAFFQEVAAHVAARREQGWLVFYEEVRNDLDNPRQGVAEVLGRLGAEWDASGAQHPYELLAPILGEGLVLQDNAALLGRPGADVRNVDVSMSQLLATLPPSPPDAEREPVDLAEARTLFDGLPPWVQVRIRAAVRIALATSTSGEFVQRVLPAAITSERETLVVATIRAEPERNILVLYGQAHVDAMWRRLQAADPGWRIVSDRTLRAF